ncbi:tensin-3 isoform X2 [Chanos chanos]|nr:tensin-3 isoform X2 [Chanos chanos]
MENWLQTDPLHVVVIHCRGGKGRIGVIISSFVHFTDISASADQALDRFAMRKFYDDKVSALMTPSQKRYVWILNSLLNGSMKMNASPLFLHCIIFHGIPNFDSSGVCRPYLKVYQGMQPVYSSGVYNIGPGHRNRICIVLQPAQLLKGDIMIKCYHKNGPSQREVIFRMQFHTGAVQGYNLMFEKEDMEHANKDPRFPDYGKVELAFSEGPERIQGSERWQNGPNVTIDYNTNDPLTRWDSYQNIYNGEASPSQRQGPTLDSSSPKRSPPITSITSSPEQSDHALSGSSDSGLSSASLWTERSRPVPGTKTPGPSQEEKAQLQRLLSGFGLEMETALASAGRCVANPTQVHVNGNTRPKERETDILDDEILMMGHDLRSVDSLGTLSSSCHKSSQNSLLSDGFGSPSVAEESMSHPHHSSAAIEEYERAYADGRRGCFVQQRTVPSPSGAGPRAQSSFRQGSYSTHTWVRQQQMVAAHQYAYLPAEGEAQENYSLDKHACLATASMGPGIGRDGGEVLRTADMLPSLGQRLEKHHDEEFNSLTVDIDNSIDQLNQLIMDLDPTFVPIPTRTSSVKKTGGMHANGPIATCDSSVTHRPQQPAVPPTDSLRSVSLQPSGDVTDHLGVCASPVWVLNEELSDRPTCSPSESQHVGLYRTDSVEYRAPSSELDSGVETGSEMVPPTPAFPISPPTPYVKSLDDSLQYRQTPSPSMPLYAYRTDQDIIRHTPLTPDDPQRSFGHSLSIGGTLSRSDSPAQSSWQEPGHPSVSSQRTSTADYSQHSPPSSRGQPLPHPAPNAHSSPRGSQRTRVTQHTLTHSPAQGGQEPDGMNAGFSSPIPAMLHHSDVGALSLHQQQQHLQPPLPEKRRVSDGESSLGSASVLHSGFSSPHSGSSLSIPFPSLLPELQGRASSLSSPSSLPDVLTSRQVTVKFVQDTSKYWYKPDIARDQAIAVLKDKEPGSFIIRDSHSFKGAYGLAMKVATPPPSVLQQSKKGGDLSNELVRHFLIECSQKGVRLKGCPNEPYFGSLTALVCQHSITPLALPCKLIIPDRDPLEDVTESPSQTISNSAAELLKQGAACNVWYLGSVDMESLTGSQAVQKATTDTLNMDPPPISTVVHFKVSSQGITLTDNQRKLFFRRHYAVNTVIFCALDPQDRQWKRDGYAAAKIFGFVARKTGSAMDNVCHLFAEHDPEQPASAIVNFVSKVMIGSQKNS